MRKSHIISDPRKTVERDLRDFAPRKWHRGTFKGLVEVSNLSFWRQVQGLASKTFGAENRSPHQVAAT